MSETLCWCASDARCPHGISNKIPCIIEDVEKVWESSYSSYLLTFAISTIFHIDD
jgi:hypothetical protein